MLKNILVCWLAFVLLCQSEILEAIDYEVQGATETVDTIATNFYGYSFFAEMILQENKAVLQNFQNLALLTPGTRLSLPNPYFCVKYLPRSCVDYFLYDFSLALRAPGLLFSDENIATTRKIFEIFSDRPSQATINRIWFEKNFPNADSVPPLLKRMADLSAEL